MPRPRTGTVTRYKDHFVVRVTMTDGSRPPVHLPASYTLEKARKYAAERALAATEGRIVSAKQSSPGELVGQWFERWFAWRIERGFTSAKKDRGRVRKWMPRSLAATAMNHVTKADLEMFVEFLDEAAHRHAQALKRKEKPTIATMLSWKSAINVWTLVATGFEEAADSKVSALRALKDSGNPAKGVRPPERGATRGRSFISPSRFLAFVNNEEIPLEWRRAVALAIYTYTRASELRGLTWGDVFLDDGYIYVHQTKSDEGEAGDTKSQKPRKVPIEPTLMPLLRAMRGRKDAHVQAMPDDKHMARGLRHWLNVVGLDDGDLVGSATRAAITWHDLRASGITWRAYRGDNLVRIKADAGHKDLSTTEKYLREAETYGASLGAVFPELPACLLVSDSAPSDGPSDGNSSKQAAEEWSGRGDLKDLRGALNRKAAAILGDRLLSLSRKGPQNEARNRIKPKHRDRQREELEAQEAGLLVLSVVNSAYEFALFDEEEEA